MTARADLDLHPPIMLSERGAGAADSVIWSGVASAADVLHYEDGDDEVTDDARRDTAEQLRGVPIVSAEDHQRWLEAASRGERIDLTPLGTVIESAVDEDGRAVFSAAIHDRRANADIRSGRMPAVSVGYVARYGRSRRADRAQVGRVVNHLALVPRGRDPHARIRADGEPMPKIAEMDAAELVAALAPELVAQLIAATKTEMEPLIDGCLAKRMDAPAAPPKPDEDMGAELAAAKADAAAQRARADAAESRLLDLDRARVRADGEIVGLRFTDADLSDRAAIAAADQRIAAAALAKARADALNPWTPGQSARPRSEAAQVAPKFHVQ